MSQQRRGADPAACPVIVWFRNDLRLGDHPALAAALATGGPLVALYILDETLPEGRPLGGAARWWLHHSLAALDAALRTLSRDAPHGVTLCLRRGASAAMLREVIAASGARRVLCNRTYDPLLDALDETLTAQLQRSGAVLESFPGAMLAEPGALRTGSGGPFRVFTSFWNRLSAL